MTVDFHADGNFDSTSSSNATGWSGHIDGGGGSSTPGEGPPIEVTDTYNNFDHSVETVAAKSGPSIEA